MVSISRSDYSQTIVSNIYPAQGGDAGVPCNPDARDWTGNMILAELAMQDQIIPCKHDFILRFGLDMQVRCISPLTDETASNMTSMPGVMTDRLSPVCCDRR